MTPSREKASIYARSGVLALAMAALLAVAYAWVARSSQPSSRPLEQVTIAATLYAGSCPIFAAQDNGYFVEEGVQALVQPHTSGKSAVDAILQGQAHLSTSADIPIMFAAMKKQPIAIVATIFASEKDYVFVARKDRGITAPNSLQGKRIGITLGTSGHFVLDAFLNRQRLSVNDVTVIDLKPEELAAALAKGDIDAASTWEPYASVMRAQLGANSTVFFAEGIYDATYHISGTRDYVSSHGKTIQKVLRALVKGGRFCQSEPVAARSIVARMMKLDEATLKDLWPAYQFNASLDQSLLLALEDETRWAMKNKLTTGNDMPNYLDYIYLDGMLAVLPAAVSIIH